MFKRIGKNEGLGLFEKMEEEEKQRRMLELSLIMSLVSEYIFAIFLKDGELEIKIRNRDKTWLTTEDSLHVDIDIGKLELYGIKQPDTYQISFRRLAISWCISDDDNKGYESLMNLVNGMVEEENIINEINNSDREGVSYFEDNIKSNYDYKVTVNEGGPVCVSKKHKIVVPCLRADNCLVNGLERKELIKECNRQLNDLRRDKFYCVSQKCKNDYARTIKEKRLILNKRLVRKRDVLKDDYDNPINVINRRKGPRVVRNLSKKTLGLLDKTNIKNEISDFKQQKQVIENKRQMKDFENEQKNESYLILEYIHKNRGEDLNDKNIMKFIKERFNEQPMDTDDNKIRIGVDYDMNDIIEEVYEAPNTDFSVKEGQLTNVIQRNEMLEIETIPQSNENEARQKMNNQLDLCGNFLKKMPDPKLDEPVKEISFVNPRSNINEQSNINPQSIIIAPSNINPHKKIYEHSNINLQSNFIPQSSVNLNPNLNPRSNINPQLNINEQNNLYSQDSMGKLNTEGTLANLQPNINDPQPNINRPNIVNYRNAKEWPMWNGYIFNDTSIDYSKDPATRKNQEEEVKQYKIGLFKEEENLKKNMSAKDLAMIADMDVE